MDLGHCLGPWGTPEWTETVLILTIQDLAKNIDNRGQADLILLDFSKAFDKVPYKRLLYKINYYGIRHTKVALTSG
jgi:hypothetical protein